MQVGKRATTRTETSPRLDAPNVLWYFGALAGTGACVAIDAEVHESARGTWVLLVSLALLAAYAGAVAALLRAGWFIPAGVLAAAAVTFVPLAGLAFERLVGIIGARGSAVSVDTIYDGGTTVEVGGDSFHGSSFSLALLTVAAGLAVFFFVRYAYVFAWVAIAALIATQVMVPLFDSHPGSASRFDAALATGILFILLGLYLDSRSFRREAFWWHLVGLVAVTAALSYHTGVHTSPGWIFVVLAGVVALGLAALFQRATYAFFGLLGLYSPFVHYSIDWFGNLGTAFVLAVTGFAILAGGMLILQRNGLPGRSQPV